MAAARLLAEMLMSLAPLVWAVACKPGEDVEDLPLGQERVQRRTIPSG